MWKKVVTVIAIVLLAAGIGFLLFPAVSNFFGQQRANGVIEEYDKAIENIVDPDSPDSKTTSKSFKEAKEKGEVDDEGYLIDGSGSRISDFPAIFPEDLNRLLEDSRKYNKSLIHNQGTVNTSDYSSAALNMSKYGVSNLYGYLSAPTIGLNLPIYLGANDYMMSCGAAHLCNTSLPLDEKDTNVAIAGHTGYIGRIFFDNIRGLSVGDTVSVRNFWETINYRVIEKKTVSPYDTSDIYIQDGRQLLTLITCITNYYGVTNRYIVICEKQ